MTGSPDFASVVAPGDVLAGKYRVERVIGVGGMGLVVAAHHLQLEERVALKFLLPQALGNAEAVARFVREARAAAKIKGEHVARVSDVGQLDNGSPYIVMEYLEGIDLSVWLKQRGPLPIVATPWVQTDPSVTPAGTQTFSWDMPFSTGDAGASAACGRVVYSDMHVEGTAGDFATSMVVPTGCAATAAMSPEEQEIEFMLFNLSGCITPVGSTPQSPLVGVGP